MGKGDRRSRRGKIANKSFGKTRPRNPARKKGNSGRSKKK